MVKPEVLDETAVTLSEVRSFLEKTHKEFGELNFRANKTLEYTNEVLPLNSDKVKELTKNIDGLGIARLKPEHIVKLIDILPDTPEDVRSVMSAYPVTISKADIEKIAKTISPYT